MPENLPRVEQVLACAGRQCTRCGAETAVLGYDESEQLDVEPARYFVHVIKREKRTCRKCVDSTVVAAPLPERIVEKGLASDRVVIQTVVAKYSHHLPLYRQAVMLARETGIDIGRATLDGWVMRVGELLQPVVAAMRQDVCAGRIYRRTKPSCRCRCTMGEERTIRRTYGSTAGRVEKRCLISS